MLYKIKKNKNNCGICRNFLFFFTNTNETRTDYYLFQFINNLINITGFFSYETL